jgi:hypothetical protein
VVEQDDPDGYDRGRRWRGFERLMCRNLTQGTLVFFGQLFVMVERFRRQ